MLDAKLIIEFLEINGDTTSYILHILFGRKESIVVTNGCVNCFLVLHMGHEEIIQIFL